MDRFDGLETQVLGLSVDSRDSLRAWADSLGGITYPLLSDFYPHGAVAQLYGVLRPEGYAERAIFLIDKSGLVRYVDVHDIDDQPDNEVLFGQLAGLEPDLAREWSAAAAARAKTEAAAARPQGDVIVYCTRWCPSCAAARAWLKGRGIEYEEIDITTDRTAAARVRGYANGTETTPTFDVGGEIIVGYDMVKVARALGLPG